MKDDELSAIGEAIAAIRTAPAEIGYTTNLPNRLRALPHDEVLATEPGTMQDERARHAQFADLRLIGEWSDYAELLQAHVASLAS